VDVFGLCIFEILYNLSPNSPFDNIRIFLSPTTEESMDSLAAVPEPVITTAL